jgi:hypothetical protein
VSWMTGRLDDLRNRRANRLSIIASIALIVMPLPPADDEEWATAWRPFLDVPIWVYNNWSAYDELSDTVPLTEELAMRELDELVRLRNAGLRLDYYVMDAFWYDPDGGYRTWRKESWPNGPDKWLAECKANGITPGLWFSSNTLVHLTAAPAWRSSLSTNGDAMAFYAGGFLLDFIGVLQYWYDRGVRLFKFDFADFDAAVAGDENILARPQIRARNQQALYEALLAFRNKNPNVILVAFNGYIRNVDPAAKAISLSDIHWLDVFDSVYPGDPRPSNVPQMDFWRSVDIYSDRRVRRYERAGVPLQRIDSTGFMIGDTGTNYGRRTAAWQSMLLVTIARGGWVNTIHGNLEFLDEGKVGWFAKVQAMYEPLQKQGVTRSFAKSPALLEPYGFGSVGSDAGLYVVVNPSQSVQVVKMPRLSPRQQSNAHGRVLFRDTGYDPVLDADVIRLGPGQLALIGFGRYADPAYDLGVEPDIEIPRSIKPIAARFRASPERGTIHTTVTPPITGDLRIILQQTDANGAMARSVRRSNMGEFFVISASQGGRPLPVEVHYDKVIWSGIAWGVGEIRQSEFAPGVPIVIDLSSADNDPFLRLDGHLYRVEY